ncbi:MAG: archaellin/type IV pilin N-terminal domain-containing protein [Candidatus Aenigmatarchaeota archaeon]
MLIKSSRLKGISPLIATVLLIALTMTIAGIVAMWASTFTGSRLEETEKNATQICIGANLRISEARIVNNVGYFRLENVGTTPLTGFKAYLFYSNPANDEELDPTKCYYVYNSSYTLANLTVKPGEIYTINFTNSSGSPIRIRVSSISCPTVIATTNIAIE